MGVIKDFIELIKGMGITGKYLGKHAVTLQYPKERMEMFERSRGIVVLLSDKETGELNCTACMLCMKICPTAAIRIDAPMDENKRKQLKTFTVDNSLCCYCGLCEEACNFDAIKLANKYEWSTESIDDTFWDINKLQEIGRDVPYEVTRKKKAAKPAPRKTDDAEPEAKKDAAAAPAQEQKAGGDPKPSAEKDAAAPKTAAKSEAEEKSDERKAGTDDTGTPSDDTPSSEQGGDAADEEKKD